MATNKNITMKRFNGADYDTLYPKTIASQVDGVYAKEEVLSSGTKTLYGLNDTAVPDDVFAKIISNYNWTLIASYKVAGTFTFTVPENVYEIGAYVVGAGGSGACAIYTGRAPSYGLSGGAAGYAKNILLSVNPSQQINLVVGAAAIPPVANSSSIHAAGVAGGSSAFNGIVVPGGEGGLLQVVSNTIRMTRGADGGQGSDAVGYDMDSYSDIINRRICGSAQTVSAWINNDFKRGGISQSPRDSQNAFNPTMVTLCAGGGASGEAFAQSIEAMPDGTKGGNGVYYKGSANGQNATGNGNGGGSCVMYDSSGTYAVSGTAGKGSDGMVLIYKRGV